MTTTCDKCNDELTDLLQRQLDAINSLDALQGWVKMIFGDPNAKRPCGLLPAGNGDTTLDINAVAELQRLAFRELFAELGRIKSRLEGTTWADA